MCNLNPLNGCTQWGLLNCLKFPIKTLFPSLLSKSSDSRRFSLMCAHEHGGISPPFSFPSIPSLCLEWQFNNYPLSVTNLFIYLFVCFGLGGWDPHRRSVFGILTEKESNPSMKDIFQSLLLLPNCWSIRMQLFLIYQCAFTSEAIAFIVKRIPRFYFVNTYSQSVKKYFPTPALCKIVSSSRKCLSSLAESSY